MKRILPFLLFALSALLVQGQPGFNRPDQLLIEPSPAAAGISADRLSRIDELLETAIADGEIPGAVALVARHGRIVYLKAFGTADATTGKPLQQNDIFRIASQTKAITATAVMMLWEEGKFRLDDPIARYIPEFGEPQLLDSFDPADSGYTTRPAKKQITIRHLLTHTSGIGYGPIGGDERIRKIYEKAGVSDIFSTADITIGEFIRKLAVLPLLHEPGEKYTYSLGLDVLGYFVEVVSGIPFDRFLRERLFEPLGMDDTWFFLDGNRADRLVAVQQQDNGKWTDVGTNGMYDADFPKKGAKSFFGGGGGLSSTAEDYAAFLQMYLNGGTYNGVRILSRTTIAAMMASQTGDLFPDPARHLGLAFAVINEKGVAKGGEGSKGTFEWGGYFNTQYFADPQEQMIGILLKQTYGPVTDRTGWKFRQLVGASVMD